MPDDEVEILSRDVCHHGFFIVDRLRLRHRRYDGSWSPPLVREVVGPHQAVAVLPYDPVHDTVVLIEQFRPGAMVRGRPPWLVEVVGGMIDGDETPEQVARRETLEESGLQVIDLEPVASFFPSPGGSSEYIELFCARVDAQGAGGIHGVASEHEDIRVLHVSATEAIAMATENRLENAYSFIALFWLASNRDRLRQKWGEHAIPTDATVG